MEGEEVSSPSAKSNGMSKILSKRGNRNRQNRDSSSLKSMDSDGRGMRASFSEVDKLAVEDGYGPSGLKKFLPKALGSKRRQRERELEEIEREEAARGRNVAERGTLRNDGRLNTPDRDAPHEGSGIYDSDLDS